MNTHWHVSGARLTEHSANIHRTPTQDDHSRELLNALATLNGSIAPNLSFFSVKHRSTFMTLDYQNDSIYLFIYFIRRFATNLLVLKPTAPSTDGDDSTAARVSRDSFTDIFYWKCTCRRLHTRKSSKHVTFCGSCIALKVSACTSHCNASMMLINHLKK